MSEKRAKMRDDRPAGLGVAHADLADYEGTDAVNMDLIKRRAAHFGGSLLFYHDPVHIVRGEGVWLYDQHGKAYLDCYNNVCSVGHCNPRVVQAITKQAGELNTHTRYLHEAIIEYAEKLAGTFPGDLDMCLFVCTGTEANELAMLIARAVTGKRGAIVMDHSYHGNSTLIGEMSTSTYSRKKRPDHIAAVEPPNLYRGTYGSDEPDVGAKYAALVDDGIQRFEQNGQGLAAFMCDGIFDSQGGLEAPGDYFEHVYAKVRAAGGLCIADEVQPGFGRTGRMWGFEQYGVLPDIVSLGKPMGNGHPVAGVVTTPAIMQKFAEKSFYFNTFGGNPVSAAAGKAVLEEIEEKSLVSHVAAVGAHLRAGLEELATRHEIIGNVHGMGLYQALELVKDRETREAAREECQKIPDALKEEGILLGLTGPRGNVLKIRPPLVFDKSNADQLIGSLDKVLGSLERG